MIDKFNLKKYEINVENIIRNASPAVLYEEALRNEKGSAISSTGALICSSIPKTGRSPKDKRIVKEPESEKDIWWGEINIPISKTTFLTNRERAIDYLNTKDRIYVFDGFAGADPNYRIKVRIIATRAYHALFMNNMLIRPTPEELKNFGEPDLVIFNSGQFPANRYTDQMTSKTSIDLSFSKMEMVILGTEYAGEMKKGVFTVANYLMPQKNILSMHCSANEGTKGDVTLFFGLSGTGKTTLSADNSRKLIGDDEHCWTELGIFNIEGGCYAKCIGLTPENEPEIFNTIKFGSILENVVYNELTHEVDYDNSSITENTRCSYPVEFIQNAKIPGVAPNPSNIILLSCDAFGVLPPVSKLTLEQAMYHFISGYTSKTPGTEMGISEPIATFSACFGAAFLVWHPAKYAELLAEHMTKHKVNLWLINTGWTGGSFGKGQRIKLAHTRAIINAIHNDELSESKMLVDGIFGFNFPETCPNVPSEILNPKLTWESEDEYNKVANQLAGLFAKNFKKYESGCKNEIINAAPIFSSL
jgi:phosphoenolpyruvate carboxykinase (ATP)